MIPMLDAVSVGIGVPVGILVGAVVDVATIGSINRAVVFVG